MGNPARELSALERKLKALEMRKAGHTFQHIANELGYRSASGAFGAVMTALKKTLQEPADELRKLELERCDELLESLWDKRHNPTYTDRILRIMERRAKLLGLDAPTKTDLTSDGKPFTVYLSWDDNESQ
jgi:hypothetical protein